MRLERSLLRNLLAAAIICLPMIGIKAHADSPWFYYTGTRTRTIKVGRHTVKIQGAFSPFDYKKHQLQPQSNRNLGSTSVANLRRVQWTVDGNRTFGLSGDSPQQLEASQTDALRISVDRRTIRFPRHLFQDCFDLFNSANRDIAGWKVQRHKNGDYLIYAVGSYQPHSYSVAWRVKTSGAVTRQIF